MFIIVIGKSRIHIDLQGLMYSIGCEANGEALSSDETWKDKKAMLKWEKI